MLFLSRCCCVVLFALYCVAVAQDAGVSYRLPSDERDTTFMTNNYGSPIFNNDESLSVGARGPVVENDYVLIGKLTNLNRERRPERMVHADGSVAWGEFKVTRDVTDLTIAAFLKPDTVTPLTARFSTTIPFRGAPDTARDIRGFAVKFYTEEGNYDFLGLSFPVFFIRDAMNFPDQIHTLKPNPVTNQQEWWRIWDFFSFHPESTHMFSFVMDDIGVPATYRHMNGFGVHTYKWINGDGKVTYIKYHWITNQGQRFLETPEEVEAVRDQNHAGKDLYDAIEAGDYPKWTLYIQTMDPDVAPTLDFDVLDATMTWPEDQFPLQEVGVMTLNKNIQNFYTDNEQLAFSPAANVPGISFSDDKLLQARLFIYADTQRYRIGPEFLTLPANIPRCPFHNNNYDGLMNFVHRQKHVNYFPSNHQDTVNAPHYPNAENEPDLTGQSVGRTKFQADNFAQPAARYATFDAARRERFQRRLICYNLDPRIPPAAKALWLDYWNKTNPEIAVGLINQSPCVDCLKKMPESKKPKLVGEAITTTHEAKIKAKPLTVKSHPSHRHTAPEKTQKRHRTCDEGGVCDV